MELQRYNGNFSKCLAEVVRAKQKIATAKQGMQYRIEQGVNSDAYKNGFWCPENFNVVDGRILAALGDYNPLIPYAEEAVKAHWNNREFYLNDAVLLNGKPAAEVLKEIAEQDSEKPVYKKRVLDLGQTQTHDVSTDSFADDKGIVFLARGKTFADKYGLFLKNKARTPKITFYLPSVSQENYSRGLWICRLGLGCRSDFDGYYRSLDIDNGSLFGVSCERSAEGASQKISASEKKSFPYTDEQLNQFLETAQGIKEGRLESLQAGKLEELVLGLKQFIN